MNLRLFFNRFLYCRGKHKFSVWWPTGANAHIYVRELGSCYYCGINDSDFESKLKKNGEYVGESKSETADVDNSQCVAPYYKYAREIY